MSAYGRLTIEPTLRLSEVEWLLDSGEDTDRVAARLATTPGAIEKACRDAKRADLLAKVHRSWVRLS